jgi:hypothetical protein
MLALPVYLLLPLIFQSNTKFSINNKVKAVIHSSIDYLIYLASFRPLNIPVKLNEFPFLGALHVETDYLQTGHNGLLQVTVGSTAKKNPIVFHPSLYTH